jgi:hypothetical protein
VWVQKISLTPPTNKESERSCICVWGVSIWPLSMIFLSDVGNILTVCYFLFFVFILLFCCVKRYCIPSWFKLIIVQSTFPFFWYACINFAFVLILIWPKIKIQAFNSWQKYMENTSNWHKNIYWHCAIILWFSMLLSILEEG